MIELPISMKYALWWVGESGVILAIIALTNFAITFQSSSSVMALFSLIISLGGVILIVRQLFARINDLIDERLAGLN